MSADADFRALLTGHAALTALVPAARIAQNAVGQGQSFPLVVFVGQQSRELLLNNSAAGTDCTWQVQCYAETSAEAEEVADAVMGAVATNDAYVVTDKAGGFDEELGIDAVSVTVQRWIT